MKILALKILSYSISQCSNILLQSTKILSTELLNLPFHENFITLKIFRLYGIMLLVLAKTKI